MPADIIGYDIQDTVDVPLHSVQQAEIQTAVFHDVDTAAGSLGFGFHRVGQRTDRVFGKEAVVGQRDHEALVFGKQRTEHLVHQHGDGIADVIVQRAVVLGQLDAKEGLVGDVSVDPFHAFDIQLHGSRVAEIAVFRHLQISRRMYGDIRVLVHDLYAGDLARRADTGVHAAVREHVLAVLTVILAACDMVGGTADKDVAFGGEAVHAVILAVKGKELTGKIFLEHVAPELRAEVVVTALFVFGNVAGASEIRNELFNEALVLDGVDLFHLAGTQIEAFLNGDRLDTHADALIPAGGELALGGKGNGVLVVFGDLCQRYAVGNGKPDLVPELLLQRIHVDVLKRKLFFDQRFGGGLDAHHQQELEHGIAAGAHEIGHDARDRLGVRFKDIGVIGHIFLQQVIGGDHVHKALLGGSGGEIADGLKHIEGLVFHGDVVVFLRLRAPEVGGRYEAFVHLILVGGQLGVLHQIEIILMVDPAHIRYRESLAAVPCGGGDLILERGERELGPDAQISRNGGQHPVLQVIVVHVPAHIRVDALMLSGSGNLGDGGEQDMAHRIHKPVAVFIAHAVNDIALAIRLAFLHQHVDTDLRGGDELRGFDDHNVIHVVQKFLVGVVHLYVQHVRAGHDADIGFDRQLAERVDLPHERDVRNSLDAVVQPFLHVLFYGVAPQHHQHLAVVQQAAVHGIEGIWDQVVVERVVEQDALAAHQVVRRIEIVMVKLEPALDKRLIERAEGVFNAVVRIAEGLEHVLVGDFVEEIRIEPGIFNVELVAEQGAQKLLDERVVHRFLRPVVFAENAAAVFALREAVQKEPDLAQQDHAEHGVEHGLDQLVLIGIPAYDEQHRRNGDGRVIERAEKPSGLRILLFYAHHVVFFVALINEPGDRLIQPRFVFDRFSQDLDDDPLQEQIDQNDQRVRREKDPKVQIQRGKQLLDPFRRLQKGVVQHVRDPADVRQPRDPYGDVGKQPQQPLVDAVQQAYDYNIVYQRHGGHRELLAAFDFLEVDLSAAQAQYDERQGGNDQFQYCYNMLNHTIPPC